MRATIGAVIFGLDVPGLTEAIHQNIVAAFFEDQALIKAQRATLALCADFAPLPLAIDTALIQFRRLVERALDEESHADSGKCATRP